MDKAHLPYWEIFRTLEVRMGYKPSISKYKLLRQYIEEGYLDLEGDLSDFLELCKILLLRNHKYETQFEQVLEEALKKEYQIQNRAFQTDLLKIISRIEPESSDKKKQESEKNQAPNEDKVTEGGKEQILEEETPAEKGTAERITKYFHPKIEFFPITSGVEGNPDEKYSNRYDFSKNYLPFTNRQMEKSWQYFRRSKTAGFTEEISIPLTVKKIAKEGFFIAPVYNRVNTNQNDTLLILADRQGSMTPFHDLISVIIEAAKEGGGHQQVPVYYFSNIPRRKVFRKPNLSRSIQLKEVYTNCNANYTIAVIFSDAGSARLPDPEATTHRTEKTKQFLLKLKKEVSKIIWVNPMPRHRWKETAAEEIAKEVQMLSILEDNEQLFLNQFNPHFYPPPKKKKRIKKVLP